MRGLYTPKYRASGPVLAVHHLRIEVLPEIVVWVLGMATVKATITLDEEDLKKIRGLVAAGKAASISGFVQHAVTTALHPKIPRLRVVKHQRRDARLGIHHVSLGEMDADLLRL